MLLQQHSTISEVDGFHEPCIDADGLQSILAQQPSLVLHEPPCNWILNRLGALQLHTLTQITTFAGIPTPEGVRDWRPQPFHFYIIPAVAW